MMARFTCAMVLSLGCAACADPAPGEGEKAPAGTATQQSHVIPVDYRGRWAELPAACLSHNTRRYEISAIQIDRADFSGRVERVIMADSAADVRLQVAEGTVEFRMALDDANTMRASYGQREEFILHRCR